MTEVNALIKQFEQMQKMMKQFSGMGKKGFGGFGKKRLPGFRR